MNKLYSVPLVGITLVLMLVMIGCEADVPPSLFDPNVTGNPAPVITAIVPPDSTLAGIGDIKILGANFSPNIEDNLVFFNKTRVPLTSASETQLTLKSPNAPSDSINIKIATRGAFLFSNVMRYKLKQAVWEYSDIGQYDDAYGIACDQDENLYVSLTTRKVVKITPNGVRNDFGTTSFLKAQAMRVGPDGYLYLSRLTTALYRIPLASGGTSVKWTDAPGRIWDFDFSPSGMMYAGGDNNDLYRIKPDGSGAAVASYPSVYIKAIQVFNGYVYCGGVDKTTNKQYVWRNKIISDDQLGEREVYFDWSAKIDPVSEVQSLVFAADGDMYIGTNAAIAILVVHPDGSYEPLYPGVIEPSSYAMAWGSKQYLYVNRRDDLNPERKRIIKLFMQKYGAP